MASLRKLAPSLLGLAMALALAPRALAQPTPAQPAPAQPPSEDDLTRARDLFREGSKLAESGDWEGARDRFERSLKLKRAALTLYNLGIAQQETGHLVSAVETFNAFLAQPPEPATQTYVDAVRGVVKQLDARIPRIEVDVRPAGARGLVLRIDGRDVPEGAGPRTVDPGRHEIAVAAPGLGDVHQTMWLVEGSRTSLALTLAPRVVRRLRRAITLPVTLAAVGIAGVVAGGVVFGVGARHGLDAPVDPGSAKLMVAGAAVEGAGRARPRGGRGAAADARAGAGAEGGGGAVGVGERRGGAGEVLTETSPREPPRPAPPAVALPSRAPMTRGPSSSDGDAPPRDRALSARVLGPYRLIRQLGRGSFAPVWLADEMFDGTRLREVAVKLFLLPEDVPRGSRRAAAWRDRIVAEAQALCRVDHPNVARFYALYRDDVAGTVGLAMEHVPGGSLSDHLRVRGPLPPHTVAAAGAAIAWALSAVHHAGLCHRDVKPSNVIAGAAGYKLIDFGIGTDTGPGAPASGGVAGTPGYIAPECVERGAPPSSSVDLYALGATLYRLLTGALPGRLDALPEPLVPLPAPLFEVIRQLLDPSPLSRPRHAEWVARELDRLAPAPADPGRGAANDEAPRAVSPYAVTVAASPLAAGATADLDGAGAPELCRDPPLAGRDEERDALDRAAREARGGAVRLVLVTGPLGVGRSRMLAAAIAAAAVPEGRVLHARCSPERRGPLRPPCAPSRRCRPGPRSPLGPMEDALDRAASPRAPCGAQDADEALEGVEDALLWASADEPLVLAVDDLQWGDALTLDLLRLLAERAALSARARLLVVAAARDEPLPSPPLRALLGQVCATVRPGVKHLPLGPLPPDVAARLAQGIGPLGPEVVQAVVRGAGGNPFFAVHAVLAWRETGALVFRGGAFHAAADAPPLADVPGVAALLEARLGAWFEAGSDVERAALRALAATALYGGGLAVEVLLEVGGDEASVERALEVLVGAGVLTVAGDRQEYGFAAEMVRQAALNLVRQRPWFSRLYRALLDAIARGAGALADPSFLATGYERLGAFEPARAWLRRAMDGAAAAGLFADAAELGDRLAAITPDPDARAGVALDVVRALIRGRRFEDARRRLAALASLAETAETTAPPSRNALRRRICRLEILRGLNQPGGDDALLADADRLGDPTLACEARMALAGVAPAPRALVLAGEAVALAERLGASMELAARVLRFELVYGADQRDLELARGDLVRALALAEAAGSPFLALHIEGDLAAVEADLCGPDVAIAGLRRLLLRAEALGMQGQRRLLSQNLSALLLRAGCAAEAAETALRTAALAAGAGDPVLRAAALSLRGEALRYTGDLAGALESADEAERLQRERGDHKRPLTLLRRAEILDALGRPEEARADAREARLIAEQHGERNVAATARSLGGVAPGAARRGLPRRPPPGDRRRRGHGRGGARADAELDGAGGGVARRPRAERAVAVQCGGRRGRQRARRRLRAVDDDARVLAALAAVPAAARGARGRRARGEDRAGIAGGREGSRGGGGRRRGARGEEREGAGGEEAEGESTHHDEGLQVLGRPHRSQPSGEASNGCSHGQPRGFQRVLRRRQATARLAGWACGGGRGGWS